MTISSSLNAGIAGLTTNASRLASISDNIANASTAGYKRLETDFHSIVAAEREGSYAAGGVGSSTTRLIDERGALITTTNSTDLAVTGRGMLPVASVSALDSDNAESVMMLTTTGSFRTDAEGRLTTAGGLALLGWPANDNGTIPNFPRDTGDGLEPVQINVNQLDGEPTTEMRLRMNLPAADTEFGSTAEPQQLSIEYYDNLGISESLQVELTPTVAGAPGLSNEWTMVVTDSASAGAVVGEYTLTFDTTRELGGTLAGVASVAGGAYDAATGTVVVTVAGGPIELDIGLVNDPVGITQLADRFAPVSITKDGQAVANMTGVEVDERGFVSAQYSTGVSKVIYQVPLVDLPNPNGMTVLDQQTYLPSPDSGAFFLWEAGEGPTGAIAAFAREESTTDVATELTDMIQTQRAYSSNAKVIQTVDEMLQETTNLKR